MTENDRRPIPREVIAEIQANADQLADAAVAAIVASDEASPEVLGAVRAVARAAVVHFAPDASPTIEQLTPFRAQGVAPIAAERELSQGLAFMQRGSMGIWAEIAELPTVRALEPTVLSELAAAMMEYVSRISDVTTDGYDAPVAREARKRHRSRQRLAQVLLSDHATAETIDAGASEAEWELPPLVRVAIARRADGEAGAADLQGPPVLRLEGDRHVAFVLADGEDVAQVALAAAREVGCVGPVALGPAVPPQQTATSRQRAVLAHERLAEHRTDQDVLMYDHLEVDLLLLDHVTLTAEFVAQTLAPFGTLDAQSRDRLLETLAAWVARPDRVQAIADELGIHVQTVRYRLRQLRELLGDALDDPERRFRIALALRARAALGDRSPVLDAA